MGSFVCTSCNRPVFLRAAKPPPVSLQLCCDCERTAAEADEAICFTPPDELTTWHDSEEALIAAAAQHSEQRRAAQPMPVAKSEEPDAVRWLAENKSALYSSNEFVEEHGLPLGPRTRPLA